jgi:hypothetical protein
LGRAVFVRERSVQIPSRATVDNLLFTAKPNLRCLLVRNGDLCECSRIITIVGSDGDGVSDGDVTGMSAVQQVLLDEMDWVGTTEIVAKTFTVARGYMLSSNSVNLQESDTGAVLLVEVEEEVIQKKQATRSRT